jgi:hypothetical protein
MPSLVLNDSDNDNDLVIYSATWKLDSETITGLLDDMANTASFRSNTSLYNSMELME